MRIEPLLRADIEVFEAALPGSCSDLTDALDKIAEYRSGLVKTT